VIGACICGQKGFLADELGYVGEITYNTATDQLGVSSVAPPGPREGK
jgi:hypothetical protein